MTRFDERRLQLAMQHERALRRFAAALLRDPADVDDATQHALLQEASGRRAPGTGVWPFLCSVLRRHAANLHKFGTRRQRHERAAARAAIAPAADELLAREQLRRRIADAVLELDEPFRTTVWLRWFEDLDTAAVAAQQGVPVATVRTRLQRAHAQLRRRLEANGDAPRWALLLGLPWSPASLSLPLLSGMLLMSKKLIVVVAAVALVVAALPFAWPSPAGSTVTTRDRQGAIAETAALVKPPIGEPLQRSEAGVAAGAASAATATDARFVHLAHADGTPAQGFELRWWTANERPGWTEPVDPAKVRPDWPMGMGPGTWSDPWNANGLCSAVDGAVPVPAGPLPVALSVRLTDGLYFSTAWSPSLAIVELPALARLDLAVTDAPAGARWRGGCFASWREQDGESNYGYSRVNVTTASGTGVVRWDRIAFRCDGPLSTSITVLAGHACAVNAEGIGFRLEPPTAIVAAPGAATFRCTELVPQVLVHVVDPDGADCARDGWVWLVAAQRSTQEQLSAGRASFDRLQAAGANVVGLLDDGSWLQAAVPPAEQRDVAVRLSLGDARAPVRVGIDGGFTPEPSAVWIDTGKDLQRLTKPEYAPVLDAGGLYLVDDGQLLLNNLPEGWRGGIVKAADGRVARFARGEPLEPTVALWLPMASLPPIDLPALSAATGGQPFWSALLELECPTAAGGVQWLPLRRFRRLPLDDHPEPLVPWSLQLPQGWRARVTITGGLDESDQMVLRQLLLP